MTPHHRRHARRVPLTLLLATALAACSAGDDDDAVASVAASTSTVVPTSTVVEATTTSTTSTSTTSTTTPPTPTSTTTTTTTSSTTSTTTTTQPPVPRVPSDAGTELVPFRALDLSADVVEIGRSVLGAPIIAERLGTPGERRVLVIGVIHGDEDAGTAIVDELRRLGAPDGVELWLVESMNPDGQAAQVRHNANQVDLNRNFPYKWGPIGVPGDGQYAGSGPASEPETQAMVNFIAQLRPDIAMWYHQDLYVISPGEGREGRVRARYAELTALPIGGISGGTYTGVAATWARRELAVDDSVAFIVELGETLSPEEATMHADAVRTIAAEG